MPSTYDAELPAAYSIPKELFFVKLSNDMYAGLLCWRQRSSLVLILSANHRAKGYY
jgi:hypothetical protein